MDADVDDLVANLRGADRVGTQWNVVDRWAEDGDVDRLKEAATALAGPPPTAVPDWAARSVFDRIAQVLALTSRPGFAGALPAIARSRGARELASLAAFGQSLDACSELVAAGAEEDVEFLACLAQELLLRGEDLEHEPFASFWRKAEAHGHPLAWLPLRLAPIEADLSLPSYTVSGSFVSLPDLRSEAASRAKGVPLVRGLETESTVPGESARISSAVSTWAAASNGLAEARVFDLRVGEPGQALGMVLDHAELECLDGGRPSSVTSVSASEAFRALFTAAAYGGAYDRGSRGAYGRLNAWQTVGALVGADVSADFSNAGQLAERAQWFTFETDSAWFYDVAWDIALAVIAPNGSRLAVLAATDTD